MAKSGERNLWTQVILRAVLDLHAVSFQYSENVQPELIQADAKQWFASNKYRLGSFKWACDHTGLDTGIIRRGVFALSRADLLHRLNKLAQENQARKVSASF